MKKILILDDDPGILEALRIAVETEGYDVKTEGEPANLVKKVRIYKPDIILLDLLLSGFDGTVIVRELKKNKDTKNIPVVILSAHPTAKKSAEEAGADDFVAKPFDVDTLFAVIEKHID